MNDMDLMGKTFMDWYALDERMKIQLASFYLEKSEAFLKKSRRQAYWKECMQEYRKPFDNSRTLELPINSNTCFAMIETMLPVMNDNWPEFSVTGDAENDTKAANAVQYRFHKFMKGAKWKPQAVRNGKNAAVYGESILQLDHQVVNEMVTGRFSIVDPLSWRPAPRFRGLDIAAGQALFHGFKSPMYVEEIHRDYGIKVNPSGYIDDNSMFVYVTGDEVSRADCSEFCEIYFLTRKTTDPNEPPHLHKFYWIGEEVIFDGSCPYNRMPYFMHTNYGMATQGFGISDIDLVRMLVRAMDRTLQNSVEGVRNINKPFIFGKPSWIKKAKKAIFERLRGLPIPAERGDYDIQRPPELPHTVVEVYETLRQTYQYTSGIFDVSVGKAEFAGQPGYAIRALQETAEKRVREKLEYDLPPMMEEIGEYVMEVFAAEDKATQRFITESGELDYIPGDVKDTNFNIEINVTPNGRPTRLAEKMEAAAAGYLGPEDVIKEFPPSWGDPQDILARFYMRNAVAAYPEAEKAFSKLAERMMIMLNAEGSDQVSDPANEARYKRLEQDAGDLLREYPQLVHSNAFKTLPCDQSKGGLNIQGRLLLLLETPTQSGEMPEGGAVETQPPAQV